MKASATFIHCLVLVSTLSAAAARADVLEGRVARVKDGDTVVVLDASNTHHDVRLAGIDAPETNTKQGFSAQSRENLASLALGKDARVEWHKLDRYGRKVGKVIVGGRDANLEQVRAGFAWWYREYAKEQIPSDRELYRAAESEARAAKRGLWIDPKAVPPWKWRRNKGKPEAD